MTTPPRPASTAHVAEALDQLAQALAALTAAEWRRLRVFQPSVYEQIRGQLEESDRNLVAQLARHVADGLLPASNVEQYLIDTLHLSPEEASTRIQAELNAAPPTQVAC
jgi:hypothetical protein